MSLLLGVNIDHVATLRQARYALMPESPCAEPDLIEVGGEALAGGADSITIHLREDRRHIQDDDVWRARKELECPLNLEIGNTPEIVVIAERVRPDYVCLVPEHRKEITTEGGLDVVTSSGALKETTARLQDAGSKVSYFIDPDGAQVDAAASCGADMIELHTGTFANVTGSDRETEVARLSQAARQARAAGIVVNAGHGLTTANLPDLFAVPHMHELNIGHHLVSRALVVGLRAAVEEMVKAMSAYEA